MPGAIKKLVFANAPMHEIQQSTSKDKTKKKVVLSILAWAKLMAKYRLVRSLKKESGLSRRSQQFNSKAAKPMIA